MKNISRIISLVLSLSIMLSLNSIAFAETSVSSWSEKVSAARSTALVFIDDVLKTENYTDMFWLKSIDGDNAFMMFVVEGHGYVIVDVLNNTVVEGSTGKHPYFTQKDEIYFFNGPLNYYQSCEGKLVDLMTNKMYNRNELEVVTLKIQQTDEMCARDVVLPRAEGDYTVTISGTVPSLSSNLSDSCGAVAAAMFFRYYDEEVNPNYVETAYQSGGVSLFPNYLYNNYIHGGTYPDELFAGVQEYVNYQKRIHPNSLQELFALTTYTSAKYKNYISADRPVIVGVFDDSSDPNEHNDYENHWVTGYGYYVRRDPNISTIIVNYGDGRTGVHLNPGYLDYLIYGYVP